jgi:hypothetical protein
MSSFEKTFNIAGTVVIVLLLIAIAVYQQLQIVPVKAQNVYGTPTYRVYMAPVPSTATTVISATVEASFYCNNTTSSAAVFSVADASSVGFVSSFSLPANSNMTWPPGGRPVQMQGIVWSQTTANAINCAVEGYK